MAGAERAHADHNNRQGEVWGSTEGRAWQQSAGFQAEGAVQGGLWADPQPVWRSADRLPADGCRQGRGDGAPEGGPACDVQRLRAAREGWRSPVWGTLGWTGEEDERCLCEVFCGAHCENKAGRQKALMCTCVCVYTHVSVFWCICTGMCVLYACVFVFVCVCVCVCVCVL